MKKLLLLTTIISLTAGCAMAFEYLGPTNEANRNFSTIKQHQFEKQETLDFVNNPAAYKEKREKKDAYLDYKQGKTTEIPSVNPQINVNNASPQAQAPAMHFTKDENGQIKIQSY